MLLLVYIDVGYDDKFDMRVENNIGCSYLMP